MYNNQFNDQLFNPQYVNPNYYFQNQQQILKYQQEQELKYQQEQNKEVANVVKAFHDLCEASKKLDPQHQQQAFYLVLAEMSREFGWDNR